MRAENKIYDCCIKNTAHGDGLGTIAPRRGRKRQHRAGWDGGVINHNFLAVLQPFPPVISARHFPLVHGAVACAGVNLRAAPAPAGRPFAPLHRRGKSHSSPPHAQILPLAQARIDDVRGQANYLTGMLDFSGLTEHRPHPLVCCCSSVVERVIGNDEAGSSILPSSTILDGFHRPFMGPIPNSAQPQSSCTGP